MQALALQLASDIEGRDHILLQALQAAPHCHHRDQEAQARPPERSPERWSEEDEQRKPEGDSDEEREHGKGGFAHFSLR